MSNADPLFPRELADGLPRIVWAARRDDTGLELDFTLEFSGITS
jgi:hypothetical protein